MKVESILGERAYGYPEFWPLRDLEYQEVEHEKRQEGTPDNLQLMFDIIFAVDPRTGLPSCDVAVFMSENTSPEIKQFIATNLMREHVGEVDAHLSDGLDDDVVAELTRGSSEGSAAYRNRVYKFLENERKKIDSNRSNK